MTDKSKRKWISVTDRLPEEHNSMFAKWKGTDRWSNAMFEKVSDTVIVTVQLEDGSRKVIPMHTIDGKWKDEISVLKKKVIAWQPLPEPYRGNE